MKKEYTYTVVRGYNKKNEEVIKIRTLVENKYAAVNIAMRQADVTHVTIETKINRVDK